MAIHGSLLVLLLVFGACTVVAAVQPGARIFVALLVTHTLVLLASPSHFGHYSILTATPLALVVGVSVGRVAALVPRPDGRAPTKGLVPYH